jgi:hypothetical protein
LMNISSRVHSTCRYVQIILLKLQSKERWIQSSIWWVGHKTHL